MGAIMQSLKLELLISKNKDLLQSVKEMVAMMAPGQVNPTYLSLAQSFTGFDMEFKFRSTKELPEQFKKFFLACDDWTTLPPQAKKFDIPDPLVKKLIESIGKIKVYGTIEGVGAVQVVLSAEGLYKCISNFGGALLVNFKSLAE